MKSIKQLLLNNHNLLGIVEEANIDNVGYWKMLIGNLLIVENDKGLYGILNRSTNSVILVKIEEDQFNSVDVNDISIVTFEVVGSEPMVGENKEVVH